MSGAGHTLQATALVNEVYLRLVEVKNLDWRHWAQFFAVWGADDTHPGGFSGSRKKGGGAEKVNVNEVAVVSPEPEDSVMAVDRGTEGLLRNWPLSGQSRGDAVFFGGLTMEEIAAGK